MQPAEPDANTGTDVSTKSPKCCTPPAGGCGDEDSADGHAHAHDHSHDHQDGCHQQGHSHDEEQDADRRTLVSCVASYLAYRTEALVDIGRSFFGSVWFTFWAVRGRRCQRR